MDQKTNQLLEDIKKLIILQLVKGGKPISTNEIGHALGVTGRTIRKTAVKRKKPRKSKAKKTNKKRKSKRRS